MVNNMHYSHNSFFEIFVCNFLGFYPYPYNVAIISQIAIIFIVSFIIFIKREYLSVEVYQINLFHFWLLVSITWLIEYIK